MEPIFITLLFAFPLAGALIRRQYAVALPLVGWPLFYFGLHNGWWGSGIGDAWKYPAVWATAFGVVTTALAVVAARKVGTAYFAKPS